MSNKIQCRWSNQNLPLAWRLDGCPYVDCPKQFGPAGHFHCRGFKRQKRKGKLIRCRRDVLFQQYCHDHQHQAKCFYIHCTPTPMTIGGGRAYCWSHEAHFKRFWILLCVLNNISGCAMLTLTFLNSDDIDIDRHTFVWSRKRKRKRLA